MPRHRPETPEESRTPPDINHLYSIKVDNLSFRTTLAVVESHFKEFGKLGDIYVPRDRNSHESRGFAFVRFFYERDAEDALDSMDGKVIDGRRIRCAMARYGRPSGERPKRGFRSFYQEGRASAFRGRGGGGGRFRGGFSGRERSRSSSRDRYRRSRSRSRSPRYNRRRSFSRSPPNGSYSPRRSRSRSPNAAYRSRSPIYRRGRSRSR